jgi:hypothetical protein
MNGGSSSNDAVAATATNAATAATALWGAGSLTERFGNLSGRELQEHCFQMYQAFGNSRGPVRSVLVLGVLLPACIKPTYMSTIIFVDIIITS